MDKAKQEVNEQLESINRLFNSQIQENVDLAYLRLLAMFRYNHGQALQYYLKHAKPKTITKDSIGYKNMAYTTTDKLLSIPLLNDSAKFNWLFKVEGREAINHQNTPIIIRKAKMNNYFKKELLENIGKIARAHRAIMVPD